MTNKTILPTYCINRVDRKDRWVNIKKILKKQKWRVKRFNAIIDEEAPFFWCTLSHRKIIEIALKRKLDYVCVLEDDIFFNEKEILLKIDQMLKIIPDDWHILYLWWTLSREANLVKVNCWLYKVDWLGDAHALIYHRRSYSNLLKYLPKSRKGKSTNIMEFKYFDHFLWCYYQKKYPCFICKILVDQKTGFSDIQKKIRRRNFLFEKIRFLFYKNKFWRYIFIYIGKILDGFNISSRSLGKKEWFWLDYLFPRK